MQCTKTTTTTSTYSSFSDSLAVLEVLSRNARSPDVLYKIEKARNDSLTVWFQESDPHSQYFYSNLEFRVVGELKLDEEQCDQSGNSDHGGKGSVCTSRRRR